ncbi:hypothetical protein D9757_008827 [Collybiopsis confluens]|uniref:Homeobox domain-containing protein n=1 Tax=Collybiopsis confluens TaxID=2823264 RepID=A0A8H5H3J6_9AGAR|nr:hypothetical protein D9757_008827 [Collybiopsis confluens]
MSKSSSRSTNNNSSPPPSGDRHTTTTSPLRTRTHEATAIAVEHNSPSAPTLLPSSTPEPIAGPSRIRSREARTHPDEPMAKRFRTEPMGSRQSDRSSPSSDSQGGMADIEDGEQTHNSERSPAPSEPPKKKRTRTLTTPHQSAVLHALLAKSRFPTTAMREEVGRAIGLSARKVQIWFQNQRQKARRPRTNDEMPTTQPPQYGPFPSGGDTEILNLYPRSQQDGIVPTEYYDSRAHPSHSPTTYLPPPAYTAPPSLPSSLLGPGVPGVGRSRERQGSLSPVSPTLDTTASRSHFTRRDLPHRSPSPPWRYDHEQLRPSIAYTSSSNIPYRDASRTLPPLMFPPQTRAEDAAALPSLRSAPASASASAPPLALAFARSPASEPVAGVTPASLPPPFTLEPQPQWNDPIFTSVPLTGSSTWSMQSSERGGSLSPTTSRSVRGGPSGPELPAREGRYDPVRALIIPYHSPKSSQASEHEKE